jgi:hypothetical protein
MKQLSAGTLGPVLFIAFAVIFSSCAMSRAPQEYVLQLPDTSFASIPVQIQTYSATPTDSSNMPQFVAGDSIFLYDGELYYRARAHGRDFFVSRNEILKHSDSLVVYQSLRLTSSNAPFASGDSILKKAERQRCTAITKNGARCKRQALPGSDKCWQHKK